MLQLLSAFQSITTMARGRLDSEDGATAVEYGLMVALIAVVIIGFVATLGTELGNIFDCVGQSVAARANAC